MQNSQKNIALKGMDLQIDESYMPSDMARFIKGFEVSLNNNISDDGGNESNSNSLSFTPNQSNEIFETIAFPLGENRAIGYGYIKETGHAFIFVWNSNNQHTIWRLNANDRSVNLVIKNECLDFQYKPEHFINYTRFSYATYDFFDKNSEVKKTKTWIFFTDNNSRTKQINVEDAIATNGFSVPFFADMECCDICTMITMGAPAKPTGCISITPIERVDTPEERSKYNILNFRIWQFRLKAIDVWGRESIHGVISKQYYNSPQTSCTNNEILYPRCIDLTFDAGCNYISSYVLEYRNCGLSSNIGGIESEWKEYEKIDKYSDCDTNGNYESNFWNRIIPTKYFSAITEDSHIYYNQIEKTFTVRFSGNKEIKAIPSSETSIAQNYIPNKSNSVFRLGNKIGVANNERGFNPLLCKQLDNIKFELINNSIQNCAPHGYRKIVIWGIVWSPLDNKVTNIRYIEKDNDSSKDTVAFGRVGRTDGKFSSAKDNPYHYDQYMQGVDGFVMYAVGHDDIYSISKQYDVSSGTPVEVGVMQYRSDSSKIMQKWEFFVPKGKYVFAIADTIAGITNVKGIDITVFTGNLPITIKGDDTPYRKTSANFIGLTDLNNIGSLFQNKEQHQITIDCYNSDIELYSTPVMIWDLTRDVTNTAFGNFANVIRGYIQNSNTDNLGSGIELASVSAINTNSVSYSCSKTDHNGYFFMTTKGGSGSGTQIQAKIDIDECGTHHILNSNPSTGTDEYIRQTMVDDISFFEIKGLLLDCNKGTPIVNQLIVYENGQYAKTDSSGRYSIKAHGNIGRLDRLVLTNLISSCLRVRCDDECSADFDFVNVDVPGCSPLREVIININSLTASKISLKKTLMQGRYGIGVVLEDCLGMETFVQSSEKNYIDVISTSDINSIGFDISLLDGLSKFKKLSFYVTENLSYSDWLEWVADYTILEDNNGLIGNPTAVPPVLITFPKRLRIYISSLVNYTVYSQSNTSWQFLKGDLIQFFELGSGDPLNITKLVNYTDGDDYVTVEYDESMSAIVNDYGTKIRLLRSKTETDTELFYQICDSIKINSDGKPAVTNGIIQYSNVFKLQREIPTYISKVENKEITVNVYNTERVVVNTKLITTNVSIPTPNNNKRMYILNHHSPSDFWGNKCWGRGRINIKNPYEKIHRLATEISLSKGISAEGLTNYLHWFEKGDSASFEEQSYHSITGVVVGQSYVLAICQNNYFTLVYDQNEFRADSKTGQIYANTATNKFGKPRTKIGNDYGCQQAQLNTICYSDGSIFYLDAHNGTIIKHNFDGAEDYTPIQIKGWLTDKIKSVASYNSLQSEDLKYFHAIVCPKKNEYILSVGFLNQQSNDFINNERGLDIEKNESVAIDKAIKKVNQFYHFTPELFGNIESEFMGAQLITFRFGQAYIHYPVFNGPVNDYLKFYGTQCKKVYEAIFNLESDQEKNFLFIEVKNKEHLLYIDRVISESGQESRIMPLFWQRYNNFWVADFKCQTNGIVDPNLPTSSGVNSVLDGDTIYGRWVKVRFVSKDADDNKYCELKSIICYFNLFGKK